MFNSRKASRLERRCDTLSGYITKLKDERETLEDENFELRKELKETQHKKKIEEEEIRHLIKIREEKCDIDFMKRDIVRDSETAKEIETVKDKYRDKIEKNLEKRGEEIKELFEKILKRLPDVNVMLNNNGKSTPDSDEG